MKLIITSTALQELRTLQTEKKFVEENLYPGAPDESTRIRCEAGINDLLERLITSIERNPQKDFVKDEFLKALSNFEEEDTEEREEAWEYLSRIMAILGVYVAEENLNDWLYGRVPNE